MPHDLASRLPPELHSLALVTLTTALMWIPYLLARVLAHGLWPALANPPLAPPAIRPWADRAKRAHANAVENLAVFAPLLLTASAIGAADATAVLAAQAYLVARVVHYVVYVFGIPIARTLAFLCGFAATLVVAWRILGMAA